MGSIVTLDHILMSVLITLIGGAIWAGRRYILRDDIWKMSMSEKMEHIQLQRAECMREFAAKRDVDNVWNVLRKHGERISALEGKHSCE